MSDEREQLKDVERFWLEQWPDEKKSSHWSVKGLNVLSETLAFAKAYSDKREEAGRLSGMQQAAQWVNSGAAAVIREKIAQEKHE